MKYMIVSSPNLEGLSAIVNDALADGWIPVGGPFVVPKGLWLEPKKNKGKYRVAQAMVKDA